ncbi:Cytosolic 5'-nucleotidase 1A [Lonchura striata]|uniref:Cytosolic 5'-nucleotidase 1A n=1 Tax=Lonchura striata TaxID=40157 RepID=A0A218UGD7_9PASE|nr:Cytosolic 5'-nucleotidase 1A [Lonchura striata domestica]
MGCHIKRVPPGRPRLRELPGRARSGAAGAAGAAGAMEPPGPAGAPGRPWDEAKAFYDNLAPKKKPKSPKPENAITIAVSSRALFRMEEEQKIYTEQGVEAYVKYQLDHENEPFLPGAAFPFVKVSGHRNFGNSPGILGRGQSSCGARMDTSHRANTGWANLPASDVLLPGLDFPS